MAALDLKIGEWKQSCIQGGGLKLNGDNLIDTRLAGEDGQPCTDTNGDPR